MRDRRGRFTAVVADEITIEEVRTSLLESAIREAETPRVSLDAVVEVTQTQNQLRAEAQRLRQREEEAWQRRADEAYQRAMRKRTERGPCPICGLYH